MEKLDPLFSSVEDVAARWKKPIDHVWQYAAKGDLQLMTWYCGFCLAPGKNYQEKKDSSDLYFGSPFINQWVGILPNDALQFCVPPYVENIEVIRILVGDEEMIPAETKQKYDVPIEPFSFRIDRDSVVVATEEIEKMEAKYPELRGDGKGQAWKNKTNEFNPAAKKSLIKMVYAMAVDGYGYDPNDKKSPIPAEIEKIAASLDMSIDVDTIRKWLKEGKKLKKGDI